MDCRTARLLLEFARSLASELNDEESDALEQHLAECSECGRLAHSDRIWEEQVAQAMRDVPIPANWRERVQLRLDAERRRQRRAVLRRCLAGAALAATMLLALVAGWQWQRRHPPRLDVATLTYDFFEETVNPNAEIVEAFFQQTYGAYLAPREFDYRLLRQRYWAELQGRRVPLLVFTDNQVQARVYFVSATQFNLDALEDDAQGLGSGCKIAVRYVPDRRAAHLVLYTGESLEPFLLRDQPRAAMGGVEAAQ